MARDTIIPTKEQLKARAGIRFADQDPTNAERAARIDQTIETYRNAMGDSPDTCDEDREDRVTDLLTDLMHYCLREEFGFTELLEQAQSHFNAEVEEEA